MAIPHIFVKLVSRLLIFLMHSIILFPVIIYVFEREAIVDVLYQLSQLIDLVLIYKFNDSLFLNWLSEKEPFKESVWIINKGIPLIVFICLEIYLHLIYFGYLRKINIVTTRAKLKVESPCALRFWLGLLNSGFSLIISFLFTVNSIIVIVITQLDSLVNICFVAIIACFLILFGIIKWQDRLSPIIGVFLANCLILSLYFYGFDKHARMLWLVQLVCVCAVFLLLVVLALFKTGPSVSDKFTWYMTRQLENVNQKKKEAIVHKKYLMHYLTSINMPKLWLLVTQFFQYTAGLWPVEITLIIDVFFLTVCALSTVAFIPSVAYTQTSVYRVLPPISFWLRFELSTVHYLKILWATRAYYSSNLKVASYLYTFCAPYSYLRSEGLSNNFEVNTHFVFAETNNPNNITYRCITNITGILFQVVLAYYLLGATLI